jgi:hypothetical protein
MKPAKLLLAAGIFTVLLLAAFIARAQAAGTPAVTLTWSASSGIVSNYFVERSIGTTNSFTEIAAIGPVLTYTDTNVVQGTFYWYRVRAGNPAGKSDYSNTAGTLYLLVPGKPGTLTLTFQ